METVPNSITSKFVRAVSYTALTSIIARISGVFVTVIIARYLESSALGVYTIVQSTIGLFATFIGFGLGLTATKMMAQYYINDPLKAGRIFTLLLIVLGISVILGVTIYWFFLPYLAERVYAIPNLLPLLKLALIWLLLTVVNQFYESVLIGLQGFKNLMLVQFIYSLLNLPIVIFALVLCKSSAICALIFAATLVSFLQFIILVWITHLEADKYSIKLSFTKLHSLIQPVLLDFSFPAFLGKTFEQPLSWVSILLLVKLGGNLSFVGGLTVINNIKAWVLYFPTMVSSVMVPLFTDIYHGRSKESFQRTLIFNQRFLWLSTLPVLVILIVTIRPLLKLVFGNSYEIYWEAGAILLAFTVLIPVNEVNDKAMVSMNKMWLSIIFRFIYMMFFIAFLLFFIPKYGLGGYVIAFGLSYFIYVSIQTIWLKKITQDPSVFILTIFSFVTLACAFYLAHSTSLSLILACSLVLFIATLFIEWFWIVRSEEKLLLSNQIKNIVSNLKISRSK